MKLFSSATCAEAWLAACNHLITQGDAWRDHNLALEIKEPIRLAHGEKGLVEILNKFLVSREGMPFNTVVNTIFPAQLYARHGVSGVYELYLREVYPAIKKHPDCSWGTYAHRILSRTGHKGEEINPLRDLIKKLRTQLSTPGPNRAVYELGISEPWMELPIYDPAIDRTRPLGGPCLSHLSFKLGANRELRLTAIYRSHWYVQRALGNLFGLAHLQQFVANEAGLKVGPLTCLSTMAQLETQPGQWGKAAVRELIDECQTALTIKVRPPAVLGTAEVH
ncbi:MAG: hypothetical protein JWM33_255 [Caulobacteraceae bacterium]|nr:hypothetical protein [Caulobacteraceae bacterium]